MTMKFGWGWKIALLYGAFATMILVLVVASSRHRSDLVSNEYYRDEIAYQEVLDANKNQTNLAGSIVVRANESTVSVDFPGEFSGRAIDGTIKFYAAVNKDWDRDFAIASTGNTMTIARDALYPTNYTMKLSYAVDGSKYYQEYNINLSK